MNYSLYMLSAAFIICVGPAQSAPSDSPAKTKSASADAEAAQQSRNDPSAVALLQQMEQQNGSTQSVAGSFSQTRTDPAFGDKIEAKARFSLLKPSSFRVEYLPPKESVTLINGQTSYHYIPANKQVERYQSKSAAGARDVTYLLLGFGANTRELLDLYTAQPGENKNSVKLVPKRAKDSQFKYITMEIAPDRLLPRRFTMEQTDNTKIVVTMDDLQVNAPLTARDFQPNFPYKPVDMQ